MKIAVVGGGSTYSPELAEGLAHRASQLGLHTLALTDVDEGRLKTVGGFVQRMLARRAPRVRVSLEGDPRAALEGADFVVTQIRVGGQDARRRDETLPARFGLLGQETTGVGGLCKALRTVPALLEIARLIEERCPSALLVNFTNPVSITTQALLRHARVRAVGLCNIPVSLRVDLARILEVEPARVRLSSVGLNHLSFVRGVWVDGEDVLPRLIDTALDFRAGRPANIPELDYPAEFLRALRMIPSDYLRYFFLHREALEDQASKPRTRADEVLAIERELLGYYADAANTEKPAALSKRGGAHYSHAALEVIDAVHHDRGDELVLDVQNGSAVAELPPDAVVEVPCAVSRRGAIPLVQRPLPPVIRGLIQHVKAYEELAVQAALSRKRSDVLLALAAHPLVPSVKVATEIVSEVAAELGLT